MLRIKRQEGLIQKVCGFLGGVGGNQRCHPGDWVSKGIGEFKGERAF